MGKILAAHMGETQELSPTTDWFFFFLMRANMDSSAGKQDWHPRPTKWRERTVS